MGSTPSESQHRPLHPQLEPIGVFTPFIGQNEVTLTLKEKFWSVTGGDGAVKDVDGSIMFRFNGRAKSLHQKKVLLDAQDNEILNITDKLATLRRQFIIRSGSSSKDGPQVACVQTHFTLGTNMVVSFTNTADNMPLAFIIRGKWFQREAEICLGGLPVAHITRKPRGMKILVPFTYYLTVAAGVDVALLVAVCYCVDQWYSMH